MKAKAIVTHLGVLFFLLTIMTAAVLAQATDDQSVYHFGGGFVKAHVDDARSGFFGARVYGGKMLTNHICLGLSAGYDVVSYHKDEDTKLHERLAVIPFQAHVTYFVNVGAMMQVYFQFGGGAYRTLPHLGGESIGTIDKAVTRPGGSVAIGLDYWFLLTTGVGFTFEYHTFDPPGEGGLFKYFAARVDYCLIKF